MNGFLMLTQPMDKLTLKDCSVEERRQHRSRRDAKIFITFRMRPDGQPAMISYIRSPRPWTRRCRCLIKDQSRLEDHRMLVSRQAGAVHWKCNVVDSDIASTYHSVHVSPYTRAPLYRSPIHTFYVLHCQCTYSRIHVSLCVLCCLQVWLSECL